MERLPIESSNILSAGYDEKSRTMVIEFKGGALYKYHDVGREIWEDFTRADSKGAFFHKNIRNFYRYEKDLDTIQS